MRDPGGVLGEIVARKRIDVAARLGTAGLDELRSKAAPSTRDLRGALAAPGARFIMEVKKASPSRGSLRDQADPGAIARAYSGAADAISVLTDGPYFGGSLGDLEAVRKVFPGPLLAKDFVIDPRQVVEARLHGADAVLAMLSVLDDAEVRAILAEAERLNMNVLVETHDEDEVRRAIALGAPIIGINNRDLRMLSTDLAVTERLARLVPADRLVVSESGIGSREDALRLSPFCDAFLVGSSLMSAPNPAMAARALAYGRVKICGLTRAEDATAAIGAGAIYGGIILAHGSPRSINSGEGEAVAAAVREVGGSLVAVFQDQDSGFAARTARMLKASVVQLHGSEDESYVARLRSELPDQVEIWGALGVEDAVPEARAGVDRLLYDSRVAGKTGGTGVPFDWARLEGLDLRRDILAGGINPGNASQAQRLGVHALDIGSGVESRPGHKDPAKLKALFNALRLSSRGEISC